MIRDDKDGLHRFTQGVQYGPILVSFEQVLADIVFLQLRYARSAENQRRVFVSAKVETLWVIKTRPASRINSFRSTAQAISIGEMVTALFAILAYVRAFLIPRYRLAVEAVALRQQLAVYKRKRPRPKLNRFDRLFWVVVRRIWTNWSEALILVKPETVASWHRAGYRLFWTWRSRRQRVGRPKVAEQVRDLIRRMKRENPTWGAPRIHGELLALGFEISEPTVSRYLRGMKRVPEESKATRWLAFLNDHREVIEAFDFLHCAHSFVPYLILFFAIEHDRRRILHFNVTFHPTSDWIVQ